MVGFISYLDLNNWITHLFPFQDPWLRRSTASKYRPVWTLNPTFAPSDGTQTQRSPLTLLTTQVALSRHSLLHFDPSKAAVFSSPSDSVARVANVTVNAFLSDAFLPRAIVAPPTLFDGCAFGVKCPIEGGSRNEFKAPIPVRTQNIPPFEVALSYRMRDGEGPLLLCFHLFVTVGGPK